MPGSIDSRTEAKARIDSLTGLRIIAAAYVFFFHIDGHFLQNFLPDIAAYTWMFQGGWLGVDLFFLLSGFIISYNYYESFEQQQSAGYLTFLVKRLARIYPVHLFTSLLVFVPVMIIYGSKVIAGDYSFVPSHVDFSLWEFAKTVLLVHGWSLPTLTSWNAVSWSVSCEWLAYLCFPLVVLMVKPLDAANKLLFLFFAIFILVLTVGGITTLVLTGPSFIGLIRIASEFTMGVILYRLYVLKPAIDCRQSRMFSPVLVAVTLFVFFTAFHKFSFLWVVPYFSWIILAVARGQVNPGFLSGKAFVYGGKISYSLYLCHGVCLVMATIFFDPKEWVGHDTMEKLTYIFIYMFSSIALTVFTYHVVEEPCRKYLLAMWQRRGVRVHG